MDLLHFDPQPLYFDDPLPDGVLELIEGAGACYGEPEAEGLLARAAEAAPDHLMVLVALYRYHFYRHQLERAEAVVWRAIAVSGARVGLPADGRSLDEAAVTAAAAQSMTLTRFYLSALKAAAYIRLRQGHIHSATCLLETLVRVDEADRMGGTALLDIARAAELDPPLIAPPSTDRLAEPLMDELTLDEAMEELSSAEDFLDYFGVEYDPAVVHVNRLHILQRFHDYLANNAPEANDEASLRAHHKRFLELAYRDFTVSDAVTEKVFAVFRKASGTAFVSLNDLKR